MFAPLIPENVWRAFDGTANPVDSASGDGNGKEQDVKTGL
jgi:hypothetical protein